MDSIPQIVFVGLLILLAWYLLIHLPSKNKPVRREDMIPVDATLEDADDVCEQFHSSVWLRLGKSMNVNGTTVRHMCPVCEAYRK